MTACTTRAFEYGPAAHGIGWRGEICKGEEVGEQVCRFEGIQHWPNIPVLLRPPHLRAVIPQSGSEQRRRRSMRNVGGVAFYTGLVAKELRASYRASGYD